MKSRVAISRMTPLRRMTFAAVGALGTNGMFLSAVAALCAALSANAFAQSYPDKPIRVVHPSSPWTSVKAFVDDAKANPGKINYAHTGPGGLPHLTAELFRARTGVDILGVAYKSGGEA